MRLRSKLIIFFIVYTKYLLVDINYFCIIIFSTHYEYGKDSYNKIDMLQVSRVLSILLKVRGVSTDAL